MFSPTLPKYTPFHFSFLDFFIFLYTVVWYHGTESARECWRKQGLTFMTKP